MPSYRDRIGQRFGRLVITAIERRCNYLGNYEYFAVCQCDCGGARTSRIDNVLRGVTSSCGCIYLEPGKRPKPRLNVKSGEQFGHWTVVGPVTLRPQQSNPSTQYSVAPCRCVCGTEREVSVSNLLSGMSQSCGCTRKASLVRVRASRRKTKK